MAVIQNMKSCKFLRLVYGQVWEGLRFVIVALPGLFSYLFLHLYGVSKKFFIH